MLDIVVPVYNEGKNIRTQLLKVEECIKSAKRVLIVYDFEEDDTLPALERVEHELSYPIVSNLLSVTGLSFRPMGSGFISVLPAVRML